MSDEAQHTIEVGAGEALVRRATSIAVPTGSADLVVALFNLKGTPRPHAGRFKDWQDWEAESERLKRQAEKEIDLDPEDGAIVHVGERLATEAGDEFRPHRITVLDMKPHPSAEDVYRVSLVPEDHVFVTHAIVGRRQPDGTIISIAPIKFPEPIAVLEGHELRFGVRFGPPPEPLPEALAQGEPEVRYVHRQPLAAIEGEVVEAEAGPALVVGAIEANDPACPSCGNVEGNWINIDRNVVVRCNQCGYERDEPSPAAVAHNCELCNQPCTCALDEEGYCQFCTECHGEPLTPADIAVAREVIGGSNGARPNTALMADEVITGLGGNPADFPLLSPGVRVVRSCAGGEPPGIPALTIPPCSMCGRQDTVTLSAAAADAEALVDVWACSACGVTFEV